MDADPHLAESDPGVGVECIGTGLALEPDESATAEANYRVGEIYISMGKKEKALEYFNVALERSPYGKWGTQSKSYLEMLR